MDEDKGQKQKSCDSSIVWACLRWGEDVDVFKGISQTLRGGDIPPVMVVELTFVTVSCN